MQVKTCEEVSEGDRLFLLPGFEATVESITRHGINDRVNRRYIECLEFHLDDGLEGYDNDDTGSMSIVRDPQDTLMVLDEGEDPPEAVWEGPRF